MGLSHWPVYRSVVWIQTQLDHWSLCWIAVRITCHLIAVLFRPVHKVHSGLLSTSCWFHINKTARSVAQRLKHSLSKRMIWGSIPRMATKWVALVTLNKCGWDNMSIVAYSSLTRSLRINSNKPKQTILTVDSSECLTVRLKVRSQWEHCCPA